MPAHSHPGLVRQPSNAHKVAGPKGPAPVGRVLVCALLLWAIQMYYLSIAPYSKPDESFNMQAIHDLLFIGVGNSSQFDHHTDPNAVPRTFVGALFMSWFVTPVLWFARYVLGASLATQKIVMLYTVRATLGFLVTVMHFSVSAAFFAFTSSAKHSILYLLLTASQFHTTFWATRALPNTFALILTLRALASYLLNPDSIPIDTTNVFLIAMLIFRWELLLFLFPLYFLSLGNEMYDPTPEALASAKFVAENCLMITLVVDSYLWNTAWMWPEGFAFLFRQARPPGTIEPWYAYFAWHVPALLMGGLPWIFVGMRFKAGARWFLFALIYILWVSCFAHKATRYILYMAPLLNMCAVTGMARASDLAMFQRWRKTMRVLALGSIAASFAVSMGMAKVASLDYPGGHAMRYLSTQSEAGWLAHVERRAVHVDVYTAQTGASRFLEDTDRWVYNKTLGLSVDERRDPSKFGVRLVKWEDWRAEVQEGRPETADVVCFECVAEVHRLGFVGALAAKWGNKVWAPVRPAWGMAQMKPCVCLVRN